MNNLLCRSLLASAVVLVGTAATATGAFAQAAPTSANVNFQGTVGSVCTFSNMVAGTLDTPALGANDLNSFSNNGTPGSVDLDCTGSVIVSVDGIQDNGSTTNLLPIADNYDANAFSGVGGPGTGISASYSDFSGSSSSGFVSGPIDETLTVEMSIGMNNPIPEGAYNYNVMVTATPQ